MKFAVVIDSTASLPEFVLKQRPIKVVPISVTIGGEEIPDETSPQELVSIYNSGKISPNTDIFSITPTTEQIYDFILKEVVPHYDYAICQSVSQSASPIYASFKEIANTIPEEARQIRQELNIEAPFRLGYINSGTTVAGQGLIAIFSDFLFSKTGYSINYTEKLENFKKVCKSFTVVKDTMHARHRAKLRGVETVGLPTALIGKAVGLAAIVLMQNDVNSHIALKLGYKKMVNRLLDYACERIEEGLFFPFINISYGGDLSEIDEFESYQKLQKIAKTNGVTVLEGVMSLTAGVNYGPKTMSLGIAPKNHKAQP